MGSLPVRVFCVFRGSFGIFSGFFFDPHQCESVFICGLKFPPVRIGYSFGFGYSVIRHFPVFP